MPIPNDGIRIKHKSIYVNKSQHHTSRCRRQSPRVYNHYDGYLRGVGRKLERILHSIPSTTVPDSVGEPADSTPSGSSTTVPGASVSGIPNTLQGLADYLHSQDELFEPGFEVADPEYIYEINLSTRQVHWFHVNCCTGDILDQGFLCEY